jgi:hypothetical protein
MTAPITLRRLDAADPDFARHLDHLLSWESVSDAGVNQRVLEIIRPYAVEVTKPWWNSLNASMASRPAQWLI